MTIMGAGTAERLGLMRLIDRRFAGVAKGVGTGKILGRVHTVGRDKLKPGVVISHYQRRCYHDTAGIRNHWQQVLPCRLGRIAACQPSGMFASRIISRSITVCSKTHGAGSSL